VGLRNGEVVEQRDRIVDQHRKGIRPGRRPGPAMAALVVAQYAVAVLQQRRLLVPERQVVAQRMAEGDPGRAFLALHLAVEIDPVDPDLHGSAPRNAPHRQPASYRASPGLSSAPGHHATLGRTARYPGRAQ